ncbi:hypothetical protein D3C81_2016310 [compost metagenome]
MDDGVHSTYDGVIQCNIKCIYPSYQRFCRLFDFGGVCNSRFYKFDTMFVQLFLGDICHNNGIRFAFIDYKAQLLNIRELGSDEVHKPGN